MNLNMQAFNINTLLGGLDKVRDVMGVYQQQLLLIVIVFALLNCFFGYALRKLWSVIPGFFLGAAAGYAAGTYTNQTTTITLALAVGTGLLTAIIAFVLYRIGLFLLICGLVGFCQSKRYHRLWTRRPRCFRDRPDLRSVRTHFRNPGHLHLRRPHDDPHGIFLQGPRSEHDVLDCLCHSRRSRHALPV